MIAPLSWQIPIVLDNGRPTPEFQRKWQELVSLVGSVGQGSGTTTLPAGVALAAGNFVSISPSGLILADPTDATKPAIGFVRTAFAYGAQAVLYLPGQINDQLSGLSMTTPPKPVFLRTNGGYTQTVPSSGASQLIGYAIAPTQMIFLPLYDRLL